MTMKRIAGFCFAAAVFAAVWTGCSREEAQEPQLDPVKDRLADPVYRAQIDAAIAERGDLIKNRAAIAAEMEKMIAAVKARMPGATDDAVKAELEKNPVWNDLYKQCEDANAAIEAQSARSREMIRQRISK